MKAAATTLIAIIAAAAVAYAFRDRIVPPAPCSQPIPYSIGGFDRRFGVSERAFLADIATATEVWSRAAGRPLFRYDPAGDGESGTSTDDLKVDLVYDYRQQATAELRSLGLDIKDSVASYDQIKAKYDSLIAAYDAEKQTVAALSAAYDAAMKSYDASVAYWNARGGAPQPQYDALQAEKAKLRQDAAEANAAIASLNSTVDSVNAAAAVLNRLAGELNLNVKSYNAIGSSTGPEFDEGEYVQDASGRRVDIYQFSDDGMLVRVLTHEFGHALGLRHVSDPDAIMYYLNQSKNEAPTAADLAELERVCGSAPK